MTEEVLNLIQENYKKRKERKQNIFELLDRIKELGKKDSVKEYLELVEQLNSVDYIGIMNRSDEEMLNSSFKSHMHLISKTNKIYLCMGTYMLDRLSDFEKGPSDLRLNSDDPRVEYKIYVDIENNQNLRIPIDNCEEFENIHTVIFTKNLQTKKVCAEIQKEFINVAIKEGQQEACQKILKINW